MMECEIEASAGDGSRWDEIVGEWEPPEEAVVDGMHAANDPGVTFVGVAARQPDGSYWALANVHGSFCLVQARLRKKG